MIMSITLVFRYIILMICYLLIYTEFYPLSGRMSGYRAA